MNFIKLELNPSENYSDLKSKESNKINNTNQANVGSEYENPSKNLVVKPCSKIFNAQLFLDNKNKSKSEINLLLQSWEQNDLVFIGNKNQTEKTEDTVVKALNIAPENIKEAHNKTELDHNQEYTTEEDFQYSGSENHNLDNNMMMPMHSPTAGVITDSQGLIVPKKLINPCLESSDRQNLHKELLFNQKIGKNVLNQKSELQRALEKQKQKERQFILQQQQQQQQQQQIENDSSLKGELDRVIMERAQKIEKKNHLNQDEITSQLNPEYLNARAKLRARIDTK